MGYVFTSPLCPFSSTGHLRKPEFVLAGEGNFKKEGASPHIKLLPLCQRENIFVKRGV
jgi:hypothetical protein